MAKTDVTQLHKDNHYVPQLYLKQWANNGMVQTYRLLVPHANIPLWKPHSLRGIAFHQHLYTRLVGKEETDEFERWLGQKFETPAEEAIRRAVNDERMTADHWKALIRFTVAQDLRTPANLVEFLARQRASLPTLMQETLEESVRTLEEAAKRGTKLPALESSSCGTFPAKVIISKGPDGEGTVRTEMAVGRSLWLWSMRCALTRTIEKVPGSRWTIVRAPSGISWPTTDNPVIKLRYMRPDDYDYGGGWGVAKCDILLPLGPKHLLHRCIGERSWPRGTVLDAASAQRIRRIIVGHAHRYVFDKEESDVPLLLPRKIDLAGYQKEQAIWKSWHHEQSESEGDF
jgi:hypothetical protein